MTTLLYQVLRWVLPQYGLELTQMQVIFTAGIAVPAVFGDTRWLRPRLRLYNALVSTLFAVVLGQMALAFLPVSLQWVGFLSGLMLVLVVLFTLRTGLAPAAIAATAQVAIILALTAGAWRGEGGDWAIGASFLVAGYSLALFGGHALERNARTAFVAQQLLDAERARSERLLLNVLPAPIAERLKQREGTIADSFAEATVLFADVFGFTELSARLLPEALVQRLDRVFGAFDSLTEARGLEKIKTIGDAYMVVGGLPEPRPDHAAAVTALALDMLGAIDALDAELSVRIGINTGPVVAGVIGTKKFSYDLWGDTVNTAARMDSQGIPSRIQCTDAVYQRLKDRYDFEPRGEIEVKGKGPMPTYLLVGPRSTPPA